jgi:hypothetical protein
LKSLVELYGGDLGVFKHVVTFTLYSIAVIDTLSQDPDVSPGPVDEPVEPGVPVLLPVPPGPAEGGRGNIGGNPEPLSPLVLSRNFL